MKKIFYNFSAACFVFLLASCYNDKGNYDYHDIGEIKIAGVEDQYDVTAFQDTLRITPEITSTDPQDVFDYYWTVDKKPVKDEDETKI